MPRYLGLILLGVVFYSPLSSEQDQSIRRPSKDIARTANEITEGSIGNEIMNALL